VDDDIIYPGDYVERLANVVQQYNGKALVGVHGRIFMPPHRSYVRDALAIHFASGLARHSQMHELGGGTCAFLSERFQVDPFSWERTDMNDINTAIEAEKRGMPRIAVARPARWLKPYSQNQPDSIWAKTRADDSEQSRGMRVLLGLAV
jgi:hypothetical protein